MGFKSDIEIAQEAELMHINEIAKIAGVGEDYLELYGKYKAKVDYNILLFQIVQDIIIHLRLVRKFQGEGGL